MNLIEKSIEQALFSRDIYIQDIHEFLGVSKEHIELLLPVSGFNGECLAHQKVAYDWIAKNPVTDQEIWDFYKTTDSYIYELSCYHYTAEGWNYQNTCKSMLSLCNEFNLNRVIDLGGGIGTLSLYLALHNINVIYYDVPSLTMDFAKFRIKKYNVPVTLLESDFTPNSLTGRYHGIFALDFFEHLPDVSGYLEKCFTCLRPNGILATQNAFNIGSPSSGGSIPMHLDKNNHYEKDWDPELLKLGFESVRSQVYRKLMRWVY